MAHRAGAKGCTILSEVLGSGFGRGYFQRVRKWD
jgi:hypothetical protein